MSLSPRAALTRQAILVAARSCFAERGFAATTTRAIAQRAGVTQPLVHHYFGSKDALFDAVIEAATQDYEVVQTEQWERPMGDLRFWTVGLAVLFRWIGEQEELMRLGAWARLEGKVLVSPRVAAISARVRERLVHAKEAGLLRAEVDIDMALLMIDAMFKGYWDRRIMIVESYPVEESELDARYLAQSTHTLLVGLLVPEAAAQALALVEEISPT